MNRINLNHAKQAHQVISSWLGEGGKPVKKEVAEHRAQICIGCPKNLTGDSWWDLIARQFALIVRRQVATKSKMRLTVENEDALGTCDACKCVLPLKVWVPWKFVKDNLNQEIIDDTPNFCWMRKIWENKGDQP